LYVGSHSESREKSKSAKGTGGAEPAKGQKSCAALSKGGTEVKKSRKSFLSGWLIVRLANARPNG